MKTLAAALLLLTLARATPAIAQIPNVQVYFDRNLRETQAYCKGLGVPDTFQVVANNFNMYMSAIEFSIAPPPADLVWVADIFPAPSIQLGQSNTGVTVSYQIPLNAFRPAIVMRYAVVWTCDDCTGNPTIPIRVQPHPGTGYLRAVEWNTYRIVQGVGMTSVVCSYLIGTEQTNWGRVKSLYR